MGALGTATVWITANSAGLNKGLGDAERDVKKSVGNILQLGQQVGAGLSLIGGGIIGALTGAVATFSSLGSEINDLSLKTGLSTNAISELGFAAKLNGADIEALDGAMRGLVKSMSGLDADAEKDEKQFAKLGKEYHEAQKKSQDLNGKLQVARQRLNELTSSGKAHASQVTAQRAQIGGLSRALQENNQHVAELATQMRQAGGDSELAAGKFAKIGLNIKDLEGLKPDELFMRVASRIADIEDPIKRAAAAQEIFGKGGRALLPMLADGSKGLQAYREQARQLGFSFGPEMIAAADKFGDTIDMVKMGLEAAAMNIASDLMPQLQQLATWIMENVRSMVSWIKANPALTASIAKWAAVVGATLSVLGPLLVMLPGLVTAVAKVQAVFTALGVTGSATVVTLTAIAGAAYALYQTFDGWSKGTGFDNWITNMIDKYVPSLGRGIDWIMDKIVGFIDGVKEAIRWVTDLIGLTDDEAQLGPGSSLGMGGGGGKNITKIPGFASGVKNFDGGLAWVGERGRELMALPGGTTIYNHTESERIAGRGNQAQAGGGVNIQATTYVNARTLDENAARELSTMTANKIRRLSGGGV